jgi:hypothetical protein
MTELDIVTTHEKKGIPDYIPALRLTDLWVPIQFLSYSQLKE